MQRLQHDCIIALLQRSGSFEIQEDDSIALLGLTGPVGVFAQAIAWRYCPCLIGLDGGNWWQIYSRSS